MNKLLLHWKSKRLHWKRLIIGAWSLGRYENVVSSWKLLLCVQRNMSDSLRQPMRISWESSYKPKLPGFWCSYGCDCCSCLSHVCNSCIYSLNRIPNCGCSWQIAKYLKAYHCFNFQHNLGVHNVKLIWFTEKESPLPRMTGHSFRAAAPWSW